MRPTTTGTAASSSTSFDPSSSVRPPGWPTRVSDPDVSDFPESAERWLWDVGSTPRDLGSAWAGRPRALAFRVACDLAARVEGTRAAYSRARQELAGAGGDIDAVLAALEAEGAALQALQREVSLVAEALAGRRWQARI